VSSKFVRSFIKTAGIGAVAGKVLKATGKAAIGLGGGVINTALTAAGALNDYGDISQKMRNAAQR
jgi:hypothetical protein